MTHDIMCRSERDLQVSWGVVRIHPAIMSHTWEDCLKLSKYRNWENVFCKVPLSAMPRSPCWSILT